MLKFTCGNCNETYEVDSVDGPDQFTYQDGNKRIRIRLDQPCHKCREVFESAGKKALEERKQLVKQQQV